MAVMNANVKWQQRMTFTGTADTGFSVPAGCHTRSGR
jgi:hypothetical protein